MPVPVPRLRVFPNPYIKETIDHLGRPAGRVPYDVHEDSPRSAPHCGVGAKFAEVTETHSAKSMRFGKQSFQHQAARYDHRIAYSKVSVEIPSTGYYRDAVKSGNLFAADKKTWVACGGAALTFVEPAVALAKAKKEAIEHFDASTGDGAHAEMGGFEPLWFGGDEPAASATPASAVAPSKTTPDASKDSGK